ncbi:MAG: hypothetical protein JEZ02_19085 [Desulfatibacillum sp.]|nr:hypothetical protein [Desulfatibacillum sp.]
MKKLVILAAILMLVPGLALADMGLMNESSLNDVTGQVGITINQSLAASIGGLKWTDGDGDGGTAGAITLDTIAINNGWTADAIPVAIPIAMTGMTIDCNTTGGVSSLVIGLPAMVGQITVGNIYLTDGTAAGLPANSLGSLTISNFDMTGSTVTIMAH